MSWELRWEKNGRSSYEWDWELSMEFPSWKMGIQIDIPDIERREFRVPHIHGFNSWIVGNGPIPEKMFWDSKITQTMESGL